MYTLRHTQDQWCINVDDFNMLINKYYRRIWRQWNHISKNIADKIIFNNFKIIHINKSIPNNFYLKISSQKLCIILYSWIFLSKATFSRISWNTKNFIITKTNLKKYSNKVFIICIYSLNLFYRTLFSSLWKL